MDTGVQNSNPFSQKGDLTISDLTITAERQSAVEYRTQFMSLGGLLDKNDPSGELFASYAQVINQMRHYEKGDLAITDRTITAERQSAVDFTTPFMSLGIAILYKKPTGAMPSLFSFLAPFSNEVYYHLVVAYGFTSLWLCVVGRMCPAEWN